MRTIKLIAAAAVALLLATVTATTAADARPAHKAAADDAPATYEITITNLTDGQWLTPPNWAAHVQGAHVFRLNQEASAGVVAVAENGGVPVLAAELADALDANDLGDSGVAGDGPIAPGASVTAEFTTSFDRFSLVSMLICTNDGFAGLDAKNLPKALGDSKDFDVQGFDAGSELNTENDADIVPAPFCNGSEFGSGESNPDLAEDGVIKRHRGFTGVGDLDPAVYDWDGPVATISITRVG